jgi:hypothetical protein
MTLPTAYSWFPVGLSLSVLYEAPQGRRVNVLGAYLSHGPEAGRLVFASYASVPKSSGKAARKPVAEVAAAHGVDPACVGPITSERLVAFFWQVAGRPVDAGPDWKRGRRLVIVLDNYSVHKSQTVKDALPALLAAGIELFYLPAYSPQLSEIEPIWRSVKGHGMPYRSQTELGALKRTVDDALADKARQLMARQAETTNFAHTPT